MNFTAPEVAIIAAATAGLASIVSAVIAARLNAKPATDQALTDRLELLIDRQEAERLNLAAKLEKLELVASDLEVMVIRLSAWGDEIVIVLKQRNIEHPPRPRFDHALKWP